MLFLDVPEETDTFKSFDYGTKNGYDAYAKNQATTLLLSNLSEGEQARLLILKAKYNCDTIEVLRKALNTLYELEGE